jgi:hypothetical protein
MIIYWAWWIEPPHDHFLFFHGIIDYAFVDLQPERHDANQAGSKANLRHHSGPKRQKAGASRTRRYSIRQSTLEFKEQCRNQA